MIQERGGRPRGGNEVDCQRGESNEVSKGSSGGTPMLAGSTEFVLSLLDLVSWMLCFIDQIPA
jgi:hypothetical protein